MKAYTIQRYMTGYEVERANELKRRRAIRFWALFTLACGVGIIYFVTTIR